MLPGHPLADPRISLILVDPINLLKLSPTLAAGEVAVAGVTRAAAGAPARPLEPGAASASAAMAAAATCLGSGPDACDGAVPPAQDAAGPAEAAAVDADDPRPADDGCDCAYDTIDLRYGTVEKSELSGKPRRGTDEFKSPAAGT